MWVDTATEYPVRMEMEVEIGTGAQKMDMVMVMDGFEWGLDLDPAIFDPNIPSDYTMMAEMKMPAQDEAGAIEGFKCFSEMTNGKYPSNLNVMTVTQEATEAFTQTFTQSIVKDMNLAPGVKPSEAMRQEMTDKAKKSSEAMQQELVNKTIKLQGPVLFYAKLTQDGKDPAYYGKDVKAGDANTGREPSPEPRENEVACDRFVSPPGSLSFCLA